MALAAGAALLLALWIGDASAQQTAAEVSVLNAIIAYDDKHYDEALRLLDEALKRDPDNVEALYYDGLAHLARKNPERAVQSFEKALALAPGDLAIRFQLGFVYFSQERYDKAEPLLAQVFAEQPKMDNVGYYVGFMRYRRKDYQGALTALTTGASADPSIQQLTKFYAGLTMGVLGLSERAVAEIEEALKILPSTAITGPAERVRESIVKAREGEQRLRAEVRLGGFYDDNVSVNPNPSRDPLAESLRTRKNRATGELATARVDYSWLRDGPWEAVATYSFFHTQPNNPDLFRSGKIQDHMGGLAGYYRGTLGTLPYQLGTQYTYDYLLLNEAPFLARHTASAFGTLVEDASNLTTFVGRAQFKDFLLDGRVPPASNRDAVNWMAGPTHVFRFDGDRHLLRFGYQFDIEDAAGRDFSYKGNRLLTGGQYTLPWDSTRLRYDYDIHFAKYDNLNSLPLTSTATMKRRDTEQLHYFRIEQSLPRSLILSLEYQGTFSQSNLALFDYHRNVFSLIMTWTY